MRRLTAKETGKMILLEYQHWPADMQVMQLQRLNHRNVFTAHHEIHQLFDAELVRDAGGAQESFSLLYICVCPLKIRFPI